MWTIHKRCKSCKQLGHKKDMIEVDYVHGSSEYWHEICYMIAYNLKKCKCGEGYVEDDKKINSK